MDKQWDLTIFFNSKEEFLACLEDFKKIGPEMAKYHGLLHEEDKLAEYLRLNKQANLLIARLYFYAEMKSDKNKKDVESLADLNKVGIAVDEFSSLVSFEEPELLEIGKEKLEAFLTKHPEFEEFSFGFAKLFDGQKHVLSKDKEKLLSYFSPTSGEGGELYSQLSVADYSPKKITLSNGEEVSVSTSSWTSLIKDAPTAEDRKAIFEALYVYFDLHKNVYGEIYNLVLQNQLARMKARGYNSILESHLEHNKIPTSVFLNLIEAAKEGAAPLHKYYEIRRKYLGLEKHRSYDRFLQLASSSKKYTYEEAKELFFKSIESMPDTFKEKAREVTKEGYVDVYPADGKRSGAYSNGGYDFHPFILLNFMGELDDVFTLAHEAGHSIHTMFSEEAQPTLKQNYTIFVAEIASTFNEHNLLDYLLKSGTLSKEDKIYLLQKSIDEIASTFYRQTLFGEYEYTISKKVENGEPINYQVCSEVMVELYKQYYGIDIQEEVYKPLVWAYIPHLFYTPFYVYQYATSFTSSMLIYEKVKEGEAGAIENYLNLLRSGGSDYPINQVAKAGVDLTKKETFECVTKRMSSLVDQLELLLKE